jgi:dTDP-4-dehydrorhamnose reductase
VHISTDFIFEGTAESYSEEDEGNPVNFYGRTKLEAEQRVKTYEGPWSILRPILMYGQPQVGRSNILTIVAEALRNEKPVRLFTDQRRLPTYVEDFVWGIEQVIARQATGIFHFCGKDALSPFEIGVKVAEYLQLDETLVQPVTAETFYQPAKRPPQTMFDLTKVRERFGYEPTSFAEGLRKTFANNEQMNKKW